METKTCGECRFYHPIWEHEGVCTATSDLRKTCDFTTVCAIGGVYAKPPPTNGDKIRQGDNRELAEISIYEDTMPDGVIIYRSTLIADKFFLTKNCVVSVVEAWLNAPAESEESETEDE